MVSLSWLRSSNRHSYMVEVLRLSRLVQGPQVLVMDDGDDKDVMKIAVMTRMILARAVLHVAEHDASDHGAGRKITFGGYA